MASIFLEHLFVFAYTPNRFVNALSGRDKVQISAFKVPEVICTNEKHPSHSYHTHQIVLKNNSIN